MRCLTKNKDGQSEHASDLRWQAEAIAREKEVPSSEKLEVLSPEAIQLMLHELRVHQIELEMQNEELHRTQTELEATRARYFDLYDLAPVGYVTLSEKGLIKEANLFAATLLGVARGELVGQPIFHFIFPEDQDIYYRISKKFLKTDARKTCDLRMKKKDGAIFWGCLGINLIQDPDSAPVFRVILSDITDRRQAEEKIQALLEEKELLLREVHHRIKNNMSVMVSLLTLQSNTMKDPQAVAAFEDSKSRLKSKSVLYDKLYCTENLREMAIKDYLPALIDEIVRIFPNKASVNIQTRIDDFILGINVFTPLGIIINELLTNVMKYAFIGRENGLITVSASVKDNLATIVIEDNGLGIPDSIDIENSTGFGLQLVGLLTKQIGGTIRIERVMGTRFVLEFERR